MTNGKIILTIHLETACVGVSEPGENLQAIVDALLGQVQADRVWSVGDAVARYVPHNEFTKPITYRPADTVAAAYWRAGMEVRKKYGPPLTDEEKSRVPQTGLTESV